MDSPKGPQVALGKLQSLPRWSFFLLYNHSCSSVFVCRVNAMQTRTFVISKTAQTKYHGFNLVQTNMFFVESNLCGQTNLESNLRRYCYGVKIALIFCLCSQSCADNFLCGVKVAHGKCGVKTVQTINACCGIKTVQAFFWRHQSCADKNLLEKSKLCRHFFVWRPSYADKKFVMEPNLRRQTLFVESKLCIQQFVWSQNGAGNKMWSQNCAGILLVVSKLCR